MFAFFSIDLASQVWSVRLELRSVPSALIFLYRYARPRGSTILNLAIKRRANARLLILNNPTISLSRLNLLPLIRLVQCEQVFDILEITGESATVRVKEFNFWLYAPFDLVEGTVDEMLSDRYYHEVDVKGKVVVDVGGFIGDTALYFASRRAKERIRVRASKGVR